jgi:uncharacterized protein YdeI (YjbR/CyaY-like superfamily)
VIYEKIIPIIITKAKIGRNRINTIAEINVFIISGYINLTFEEYLTFYDLLLAMDSSKYLSF